MENKQVTAATNGNVYIPMSERDGAESVVYFTRDLSAEGLRRMYERVSGGMTGKVGIKLHTGEEHGPNIIPRPWVRELVERDLPDATIVETNTYYAGNRDTTEKHRHTLEVNGWTFCPVDIMDEDGATTFPVSGGKWFSEMHVGKNLAHYDSLFVLTHFKGHAMGGFGGSAKNIGIGCADGKIGKKEIHAHPGEGQWSIAQEELMERMVESAKATVDHFGEHITFVNVLRNMSVSCDCEGTAAAPSLPRISASSRQRISVRSTPHRSTWSMPLSPRSATTLWSVWRAGTACARFPTCMSSAWATGAIAL